MSAESTLARVLHTLAATLDQRGDPWYLFGAQAVVIYGRPRLTADVDVTVGMPIEEWGVLADSLSKAGFSSRVEGLDDAFVFRTRVLPLVHSESGFPVDLVIAGPVGLERDFLARSRRYDLQGIEVSLISPEDLVVAKVLAGRSKDWEDVRGILAEQRGSIDLVAVYELLERLEVALSRRDLVSELERVTSNLR